MTVDPFFLYLFVSIVMSERAFTKKIKHLFLVPEMILCFDLCGDEVAPLISCAMKRSF